MMSGGPNRPSGGPDGGVRVLTTLPGTLEKRGPGFILEFTIKVHGNPDHDKAQSHFVYNSPSTIPILVKLGTESYDGGGSNGAGCEVFGEELTEDVGFYRRINKPALIRIINAFHFRLCSH